MEPTLADILTKIDTCFSFSDMSFDPKYPSPGKKNVRLFNVRIHANALMFHVSFHKINLLKSSLLKYFATITGPIVLVFNVVIKSYNRKE